MEISYMRRGKSIYIVEDLEDRVRLYEVDLVDNSVYQIYPEFKLLLPHEIPLEIKHTVSSDFLTDLE